MATRATKWRETLQEDLQKVIFDAEVSREHRRGECATFREWYNYGTADAVAATHNKLRSHLDRVASYLWSADSVRFGVHLPPPTRSVWQSAAAMARDEFRQTWALSGADRVVSLALEWALVYGCIPLKLRPDPIQGFAIDGIDPWDFAVTREDQDLEDQDAFVHWYALSEPQYQRWVDGHPREAELLGLAAERKRTPTGTGTGGPLIVTGLSGVYPATSVHTVLDASLPAGGYTQDAQVREGVIQLADVWERTVYTDAKHGPHEEWRVSTVFTDDGWPLLTRRNPVLGWLPTPSGVTMPSEVPFALLVPRPVPNYLWGRSELLNLMPLQRWREEQIRQMREVIARQLNPAKLLIGVPNGEEALRALDTPGGSFASADPGGKMETIQVQVGQEAFGMLSQIDKAFADQSGIPPILESGDQPGGVRANSQLLSLAGIGAGRIRHMALELEATLSRLSTLAFRLLQRQDDQPYTAQDGTRFLLAQLPPGTALSVSAHSASPIFAEQTQAKALELLKAGAIGGEMLTELLDPPYREEIKDEARQRESSRSKNEERMIELELKRVQRRRGK